MSTRTLTVKLKPDGVGEAQVTIFFQTGDWAVTQGLCRNHSNACLKVTHIPSTACLPPCLHDLELARKIALRINTEVPKFKRSPWKVIADQYTTIFRDELSRAGATLELPT